MSFSYNPLWKKLIDNDMKKVELKKELNLSPTTLAKMGKNENISMEILDRICAYFNCPLNDVVEHIPSNNRSDSK